MYLIHTRRIVATWTSRREWCYPGRWLADWEVHERTFWFVLCGLEVTVHRAAVT